MEMKLKKRSAFPIARMAIPFLGSEISRGPGLASKNAGHYSPVCRPAALRKKDKFLFMQEFTSMFERATQRK